MFSKILIANRGEIAVRVMRTARAMGYRTVAVYSEADADALHVHAADEAVCIGPAPVGESYLRSEAILDAARRTGADALHPGYGFLSENAGFAKACEDAGIIFIGPPTDAIELMGSKRLSKIAMQEAGVPTVPGYQGEEQSDERLIEEAARIGYPLMIKASAGGGGRGMRLVASHEALRDELKRARSEARNAFGSDELILERAVIEPRHIEIQVFADQHGNAVHLGERDCSIQRRHQKVVEEAPSPFMTPELRERMGEAAVRAAQSCGYRGAGTVEFLVDSNRDFYFLEMNTRLQVEHPVTESITGQDLVEWQLRVAAGEPLPLTQDEIELTGHAIEVRLYAEDATQQFTPQTGPVLDWRPAAGQGLRYDTGIRTGAVVSPFYDPMLAKVIATGRTREEARRRLAMALEDSVLFGVTTNRHFLARILRHPVFIEGGATTAFLDSHFSDDDSLQPVPPTDTALALAAVLQDHHSHGNRSRQPGWSNSLPSASPCRLAWQDKSYLLKVTPFANHFDIDLNDRQVALKLLRLDIGSLAFEVNGVRQRCQYHRAGDQLYLQLDGRVWTLRDLSHAPATATDAAGSGRVVASMDGAIIDVPVTLGDRVTRGQTLVVLEAMKMEHPLKADADGVVTALPAQVGMQVKLRQLLAEIQVEAIASQDPSLEETST